jgi:hypothetical protein
MSVRLVDFGEGTKPISAPIRNASCMRASSQLIKSTLASRENPTLTLRRRRSRVEIG